jgi:hypothetical protein
MSVGPTLDSPQHEESAVTELNRGLDPERLGEFDETRFQPPAAESAEEIHRLLLQSFPPPHP